MPRLTSLPLDDPGGDSDHEPAPRTRGATELHEAICSRWIDTWNGRDVEALLSMAGLGIDIHPLRLGSIEHSYVGHHGVRKWMSAITEQGHLHRIRPSSVREIADGRILAAGTVSVGGRSAAPFSGLYEFDGDMMSCMSHFFTPAAILESVGIIDPGASVK